MLCNKRVNLIIISALIIIIPLVEARREFHNDVVDDENILKNSDDTHSDDDLDDNKCISQTLLHEHEIEDREIMKTSFIPSYCKERQSKKNIGNEDLEIQKWRVRRKRSEDLINFLHLDSMHNLSQEEVRASQARIMKRYMNPNVDPCHDFYNYACGNWAKYNSIPSDKVAYDTFEILREYLDQALYQLLMGDKQEEKKTRQHKEKRNRRSHERRNAELKAKYLFQSCMNYEVIEKRGIQPLLDLLKSLGGWPLLDPNWNENNFDWLELVANLRKYNNDILIVEYVSADIQNSITNIIQFDQTSLGLPTRDYFLKPVNEKYLNSYRNFMTKIINLMGVDIYEASDFADEIIEFETNLAKIMSSQEDRTNISILYQKKSLNELQAEIPGIDFIRYLSIVQDRVVDGNEKVIMFSKKYMQQLVKLIEKTEPSTVANYILWRFVRHRVNNLDNRFLEAKQKFYQECFGRETSPQRWKTCVGQVNSNVGMAVGALFVRKYFDEKSKLDMITMVKELQLSFHNILNETDWIDESTKKLALKKLESMSLKIGFPDYILNRNKLDEKYASLHISPNKYFENTLNVLKYLNREEQKKVGQSVNKTMWQTTPAVVNAFYSRSRNQIMFPAGILQAPFYHRYFPKSLNYGGIGVVVVNESFYSSSTPFLSEFFNSLFL